MTKWLMIFALALVGCNVEAPTNEETANTTNDVQNENETTADAGVTETTSHEGDAGNTPLGEIPTAEDGGVVDDNNTTTDAGVVEEEPTFGEPPAELVGLEHATVIDVLERNITAHMDELDTALSMLDGSQSIESFIALLPLEEDEDEGEEEDFEIDLVDLRDGIIDLLKDRLLVESTSVQSDDGNTITYTVSAELLCDEEPEDDESDEDRDERLTDIADCEERAEDQPMVIHATSPGADRIDLAIAIGTAPAEGMRLQVYDDMVAAFISLTSVRSLIRVFVSAEDFELPTSMLGDLAVDVRRESEAHFLVRPGIISDIRVSSPSEIDTALIEFDRDLEPGHIRINGPQELIDGALNIDAVLLQFAWQKVVDMFHDDEDTVETVCTNNHDDAENCEQYDDTCLPACHDAADETVCTQTCQAALHEPIRDAIQAYDSCLADVSEELCDLMDDGCRNGYCSSQKEAVNEFCERRDSCEEVRTPAPDAPEVNGRLTINVPGASGLLEYAGADDTLRLNGLALGAETLTIDVNGDTLIGLDVNPDNGRQFDLTLNGLPDDGFQAQVSPVLDVRLMFAIHHVEDALDMPDFMHDETMTITLDNADKPTLKLINNDNEDDIQACRDYHDTCQPGCTSLPSPEEADTCRQACYDALPQAVRDAMEAFDTCRENVPETECGTDDYGCREDRCTAENNALKAWCEHEESVTMEVITGRLTLSSTTMTNNVVVNEGMCMGNDDSLTDDEQDEIHDLFGGMTEEVCED